MLKIFSYFVKSILVIVVLSDLTVVQGAEGTKQLAPSSTDRAEIVLRNSTSGISFARYDSTIRERLYITVKEGEKINLGMGYGSGEGGGAKRLTFRLKKMDGNVVDASPSILDANSETKFPEPGDTGFIADYISAVDLPNGVKINGGDRKSVV